MHRSMALDVYTLALAMPGVASTPTITAKATRTHLLFLISHPPFLSSVALACAANLHSRLLAGNGPIPRRRSVAPIGATGAVCLDIHAHVVLAARRRTKIRPYVQVGLAVVGVRAPGNDPITATGAGYMTVDPYLRLAVGGISLHFHP